MECDVCLIEWDSLIHIPRILSCGHTLCEVCLTSMLKLAKSKNTDLFCPSCMCKQKEIESEGDIRKLIKNINLLRIAEKIETRKSIVSQSFMNSKVFDMTLQTNRSNLFTKGNNNETLMTDRYLVFSTNELVCKKHGLNIHSYALGTNLYLCDTCLQETSLKTYPLPNFIRDVRRKVDSTEIKMCLIKQEIEKLQEFFTSYQDEFEKSNMKKVDELFNYLTKLIQFNYNTAKTVVLQCKKEQETQIEDKLKELEDLLKELKDIEDKIANISSSDDRNLVKYNEELQDLYQKVNFFLNYDLEVNLFQMQIGIKEEIKDKLFEFIQNSYYVDVEFASVKGEPPTIKHILNKDNTWLCICGEGDNLVSNQKCNNCESYRKIETLDYVVTHPFETTKDEIQTIALRRKQEVKEFQELYKKNTKTECNYLIDLEWFLLWKCFVTNDMSDKYVSNSKKRISPNKSIGILPPGPITNINLLDKYGQDGNTSSSNLTLKKGMKKNDEYITINSLMWDYFYKNYNGGPEIKISGTSHDIYASLLSIKESKFSYDSLKLRMKEFINFEETKGGEIMTDYILDNNKIENYSKTKEDEDNNYSIHNLNNTLDTGVHIRDRFRSIEIKNIPDPNLDPIHKKAIMTNVSFDQYDDLMTERVTDLNNTCIYYI